MAALFFIVWLLLIIGGFSLNWILGLLAIFVPMLLIGASLDN